MAGRPKIKVYYYTEQKKHPLHYDRWYNTEIFNSKTEFREKILPNHHENYTPFSHTCFMIIGNNLASLNLLTNIEILRIFKRDKSALIKNDKRMRDIQAVIMENLDKEVVAEFKDIYIAGVILNRSYNSIKKGIKAYDKSTKDYFLKYKTNE